MRWLFVALWGGCDKEPEVPGLTPEEVDDDGDGFPESNGDCDDADPAAFPGAVEISCNGKLEDCKGSDGNFTVPQDVSTIAEGLSAAGAGFAICVSPGTYAEHNLVVGRVAIRLVALPGGPVVIDAGGVGRGLDVTADGVSIEGITVLNGVATDEFEDLPGIIAGGGIRVTGDDVLLLNVTVNNSTAGSGGAIGALEAKNLTISGGTIAANFAISGAGLYAAFGDTTVLGTTFSANVATADGGGLYATDAKFTLDAVVVSGNTAPNGAGAFFRPTAPLTLTGGTWSDNIATEAGGAILAVDDDINITGTTFTGNQALVGGAIALGGAQSLTLSTSTLTGNSATSGGAVEVDGGATFTTLANNVTGNTAVGGGGGFHITGASKALLENDVVEANTAATGGGIYCEDGQIQETTTSLSGNLPDQEACGSCAGCNPR